MSTMSRSVRGGGRRVVSVFESGEGRLRDDPGKDLDGLTQPGPKDAGVPVSGRLLPSVPGTENLNISYFRGRRFSGYCLSW